MVFAKISQVAHYAPEQVVSNDDLAKIMETSDEWIRTRTGILRRHISKDETTSDLATEVAQKLLDQSNLSAEDLDFIIVATITPDSLMPSTAARVQANIGASGAFAFDVTAACSGFIFALSTADKYISSGMYQRGIVIGIETLSKVIDASLEADKIDYFLLHQANDRMLDKMAKKLGVSREKIPANMMEYGNTSAASIPILLSECVENHCIKLDGSQKILLTGFGGGLTWGTLLVTI